MVGSGKVGCGLVRSGEARQGKARFSFKGGKLKNFLTNIEQLMMDEFVKRGLRKGIDFSSQYPIRRSFILDFAFPEEKIAIECDGEAWHSDPKAKKRDGFKNYILKKEGWTVLRFWGSQIEQDIKGCVDRILEARI